MPASVDACVFCDIVAGTAPSHHVFEDAETLAFLDIAPFTLGHTLVIPKRHARTLLDMDPPSAAGLMASARTVMHILARALNPEGFTLLQANERAGWQTVFHVHLHVVPRWVDDGITPPVVPRRSDDLSEVAQRIRLGGAPTG